MGLILWLIVGGIVGWLASMIMKTDGQQGIIMNVVVGIVGAFIGGWLISPLVHQLGLKHRFDRRVADRRNHPAGDRQPVPPRPRPVRTFRPRPKQ
jgi:uncharacterized membrane protein YeaQ/YmgE (transglycosylase-associated protein family)